MPKMPGWHYFHRNRCWLMMCINSLPHTRLIYLLLWLTACCYQKLFWNCHGSDVSTAMHPCCRAGVGRHADRGVVEPARARGRLPRAVRLRRARRAGHGRLDVLGRGARADAGLCAPAQRRRPTRGLSLEIARAGARSRLSRVGSEYCAPLRRSRRAQVFRGFLRSQRLPPGARVAVVGHSGFFVRFLGGDKMANCELVERPI